MQVLVVGVGGKLEVCVMMGNNKGVCGAKVAVEEGNHKCYRMKNKV